MYIYSIYIVNPDIKVHILRQQIKSQIKIIVKTYNSFLCKQPFTKLPLCK